MSAPKCSECGTQLSDETGWAMSTTLADGAPITFYCEDHNPNKGRGYTLADFHRMKEEAKVQRALREVDLMNMVGPDVYFFVKEREERAKHRQQVRRAHATIQSMMDTLRQIGAYDDEPGAQP